MGSCYVGLHHLLTSVPFISAPHPYVLQVLGTVLHLLPNVGLPLGWDCMLSHGGTC